MIAQGRLGRLRPRVPGTRIAGARRGTAAPPRAPGARVRQRRAPLVSTRVRRLLVILALGTGALTGGWLWFRDSSLVAVEHVAVTGNRGPDAAQIGLALAAAARTMTTLDVNVARLRTAVAPYPVVRDVRVSTQFPHGLRINVIEEVPVATIVAGGRTIPVAADGMLLHDAGAAPSLPMLTLRAPPGGPRLTDPDAVGAVRLLGAAPYQLLAKISQVIDDPTHGLTAQVRGGPVIYFGDAAQAAAKWRAAVDVLADPGSAGATYIDVTDPSRPAAGIGATAAQAAGVGATSSGSGPTGSAGAGSGTSSASTTGSTSSAGSTSSTSSGGGSGSASGGASSRGSGGRGGSTAGGVSGPGSGGSSGATSGGSSGSGSSTSSGGGAAAQATGSPASGG